MGSSDAQWKARSNNDPAIVRTGDKTTAKEWITGEGGEELVIEDCQGTSSKATTVSSESKQSGSSSNVHTSSNTLEEGTDPTSLPSEMLDEPDRKDTESPMDSDRAVYGSNSVHSESSVSSSEQTDSKKGITAAVDLDKVEAMGGQFDESYTGREAASFHNPVNDSEARYINDKVKKANNTMEDIDLHPGLHFRDHGLPFQVSAQPRRESPRPTFDAEGDNAHGHEERFAPDSLRPFEMEEEINTERPRKRPSPCCLIM